MNDDDARQLEHYREEERRQRRQHESWARFDNAGLAIFFLFVAALTLFTLVVAIDELLLQDLLGWDSLIGHDIR